MSGMLQIIKSEHGQNDQIGGRAQEEHGVEKDIFFLR